MRELEILSLVAQRFINAEIAARLHISPKTAGHHVSAILAKLGVRSRHDAAAEAQRLGIAARSPRRQAKGLSCRDRRSTPALSRRTTPATSGIAPSTAIATPIPMAVPSSSRAITTPITTSTAPTAARRSPLPASLRSLRVAMGTAFPA
jgi:DNA-binding CsgD family transcriptional regulator